MNIEHWQNIYTSKADNQVSWTQTFPHTAISYLKKLNLPKSSPIIDVGSGASNFIDAALNLGYTNITALDISEAALSKSKTRLGNKSNKIKWIVSDINKYTPEHLFDFWYDRAVFHFLIEREDIQQYIDLVGNSLQAGGHLLLGTFSENGPKKCSGLNIMQYSESKMKDTFSSNFTALDCFKEMHTTPFKTTQEFQFCGFMKK